MRKTIVILAAALLSACAATGAIFKSKGEQALSDGMRQYEAGEYAEAQKSFAAALEAGVPLAEQIEARKHLAFIHCVSGRQAQCREEFRRALDLDPRLELAPAEAGHPSWGPAFRAVKAARR
jgi:Tfp pilus assembly protein PilF